jgi:hypothetical protein
MKRMAVGFSQLNEEGIPGNGFSHIYTDDACEYDSTVKPGLRRRMHKLLTLHPKSLGEAY